MPVAIGIPSPFESSDARGMHPRVLGSRPRPRPAARSTHERADDVVASRLETQSYQLIRTLVVGVVGCPCVIWAQRAPTSSERASKNAGSTNSRSLAGIWRRASRVQVFSDQPPAFTAEGQAKF